MIDYQNEYTQALPGINQHYLARYLKFVLSRDKRVKRFGLESHHILIKSIFPQYDSASKHPTNRSMLTPREHLIAHRILFKAAKFDKRIAAAWVALANTNQSKMTSREFEEARLINRLLSLGMVTVRNTLTNKFERMYKGDMLPHHVHMFKGRSVYWSEAQGRSLMLYEWDEVPEGFVKGCDPSQNRQHSKGMVWMHNPYNLSEYTVCNEEDSPEGWVKGNPTNDCKGRIWVNNGVEERMVFGYDICDGWSLGRLDGSVSHFTEVYYHDPETNASGRFIYGEAPANWVRGSGMVYYHDPETMERGKFVEGTAPDGWLRGHGSSFYYDPDTLVFKRFTNGNEPDGWLPGQSPKTHELKPSSTYREARPKVQCPHCMKVVSVNTAPRWHFDNCKSKPPAVCLF